MCVAGRTIAEMGRCVPLRPPSGDGSRQRLLWTNDRHLFPKWNSSTSPTGAAAAGRGSSGALICLSQLFPKRKQLKTRSARPSQRTRTPHRSEKVSGFPAEQLGAPPNAFPAPPRSPFANGESSLKFFGPDLAARIAPDGIRGGFASPKSSPKSVGGDSSVKITSANSRKEFVQGQRTKDSPPRAGWRLPNLAREISSPIPSCQTGPLRVLGRDFLVARLFRKSALDFSTVRMPSEFSRRRFP